MDCQMARNTNLSGQENVPFKDAAPGESRLCADDIVFADHTGMADLNQAVDLGAPFHARLPHRRPVNRGKALDLDVVLNHGYPGLDNLLVRPIGALGESV